MVTTTGPVFADVTTEVYFNDRHQECVVGFNVIQAVSVGL